MIKIYMWCMTCCYSFCLLSSITLLKQSLLTFVILSFHSFKRNINCLIIASIAVVFYWFPWKASAEFIYWRISFLLLNLNDSTTYSSNSISWLWHSLQNITKFCIIYWKFYLFNDKLTWEKAISLFYLLNNIKTQFHVNDS
jgi:hypothetical protein